MDCEISGFAEAWGKLAAARNADAERKTEIMTEAIENTENYMEEITAPTVQKLPLLAMRGFPLSRSGGEMHWRIPGEESVSIRGNMWYSHYRGEGGDAISFVRHFFHMDFKEAVRFLLEQSAVPGR